MGLFNYFLFGREDLFVQEPFFVKESSFVEKVLFGTRRSAMLLVGLCTIFVLSGCANSKHISQDFKPGTDFKNIKTYAWHNVSSAIPDSNNVAIQHAIEQHLLQQGLQLVTANPDAMLNLSIVAQKSSDSGTGLGLSLGLPIGNHGAIGLGTSKLLGRDSKQEGLIVLDITSTKTNQVIWRGTAEAVPINYFLLRNEPQLNGVLKRLVAQFPPQ